MDKKALLTLTGQQLFDYYTTDASEYAQTLFTAYNMIGDDLFPMLEQAEKEGKKVALKTGMDDVDDPELEAIIE